METRREPHWTTEAEIRSRRFPDEKPDTCEVAPTVNRDPHPALGNEPKGTASTRSAEPIARASS